jgi:hypothetical protein
MEKATLKEGKEQLLEMLASIIGKAKEYAEEKYPHFTDKDINDFVRMHGKDIMKGAKLEAEFDNFADANSNLDEAEGIELTADEMETLRREKKLTLPDGRVLHYVGKPTNEEDSNVNVDDFEKNKTNTRDFASTPKEREDGTYDISGMMGEALNKDIKAFGQDIDKAFKAAGFSTLVIMQPATPEQLNIVKTNPKAVLFEVSQNAEAQTLTVYVNPTQIQKAESVINKFQLSDFNGPVLKKGWTAKQVQGAINPGDIVKQDADKGRGMWYFYRLAKVDTKVKTLAEINVSGKEQKDQEKQLKEAVKALIKKTLEA